MPINRKLIKMMPGLDFVFFLFPVNPLDLGRCQGDRNEYRFSIPLL